MEAFCAQALACAAIEERRQRRLALGEHADLFGDPAWDTLLLLLANHGVRQTPVATACHASQVPRATALRVIGLLEERGLLLRRRNPRDYRSKLVILTQAGCDLVTNSLRIAGKPSERLIDP